MRRDHGLTLNGILLLVIGILLAITVIVAIVAIPKLRFSRIGSNEAPAQESMEKIFTGQEDYKSSVLIDLDLDNVGDYGYLEELGGCGQCRTAKAGSTNGATFSSRPVISRVLGKTDTIDPDQTTTKDASANAGYHFIMYLPVSATTATSRYPSYAAIQLAEKYWIAYAWPQTAGRTGIQVFVIDQNGRLYILPNALENGEYLYSGNTIPPFDAALKKTSGSPWKAGIDNGGPGHTGQTGMNWVRAD
jgi:hypothetical protein